MASELRLTKYLSSDCDVGRHTSSSPPPPSTLPLLPMVSDVVHNTRGMMGLSNAAQPICIPHQSRVWPHHHPHRQALSSSCHVQTSGGRQTDGLLSTELLLAAAARYSGINLGDPLFPSDCPTQCSTRAGQLIGCSTHSMQANGSIGWPTSLPVSRASRSNLAPNQRKRAATFYAALNPRVVNQQGLHGHSPPINAASWDRHWLRRSSLSNTSGAPSECWQPSSMEVDPQIRTSPWLVGLSQHSSRHLSNSNVAAGLWNVELDGDILSTPHSSKITQPQHCLGGHRPACQTVGHKTKLQYKFLPQRGVYVDMNCANDELEHEVPSPNSHAFNHSKIIVFQTEDAEEHFLNSQKSHSDSSGTQEISVMSSPPDQFSQEIERPTWQRAMTEFSIEQMLQSSYYDESKEAVFASGTSPTFNSNPKKAWRMRYETDVSMQIH